MSFQRLLRTDINQAPSRQARQAACICRLRRLPRNITVQSKLNCTETGETGTEADPTPGSEQSSSFNLPTKYKRLVARRCGASFREVAAIEELDLVPPGPGEVLIRVTHAGINGGCETFRARGEHAFAANRQLQDFPLGAEGAGVVEALGPGVGGGLQVGQLVAVNGAAAFSQFVTARPQLVVPVPEGLTGAEAAALVLSGVTACVALEATARLKAGEVVAVTAAAGGTGHLALQLAASAGATVVAVVGGPAKAAAAAALGAHHVVDYKQEDVVSSLRRLFPGGVDVVYEGVGGALRDQMLSCLAPEGRLLQVGYISEYPHARGYIWDPCSSQGLDENNECGGSSSSSNHNRQSTSTSSSSSSTAAAALQSSSPPTCSSRGSAPAAASAASETSDAAASSAPTSLGADAAGAAWPGGGGLPSNEELFWKGLNVELGRRRVYGQIWPKDLKAILRCRRRVFDLVQRGRLRVITDQGHGRKGLEGVADAVEYMLRGEHVGKVIIEL